MSTQHTAGPWFAVGAIDDPNGPLGYRPAIVNETEYKSLCGSVPAAEVEANPQRLICDVRGPSREWNVPSDETAANTRLIAAAPDLLEACQAVNERLHHAATGAHRLREDDLCDLCRTLEDAIAKATGAAP